MPGLDYYRRLLEAYLLRAPSYLNFWHEAPEINPEARFDQLGAYYLTYQKKADYPGPLDPEGIPLLNYRGRLGLQYNPIAIAQYGLAQFNRHSQGGDANSLKRFLAVANWLVRNLKPNAQGVYLWFHHFPWTYRQTLQPPWASALAQGQGISVLVRAKAATATQDYLEAAQRALRAFEIPVDEGGVVLRDSEGNFWLEEYLVDPPTHILNGSIGASWGLLDLWLATREESARKLFQEAAETLAKALPHYDTGFWSCYQLSPNGTRMLASPFYHRLHIAQLKIMAKMTGQPLFDQTARRWEAYEKNAWCRTRALCGKAIFKLLHY